MRTAFHEQLALLNVQLADMASLAGEAMQKATTALLDGDLDLAEYVISADFEIDSIRVSVEDQAFGLLALQAPVARDLRAIIATIHSAGDLERMGDLALHVAKAARRRYPALVVTPEVAPTFAQMGKVAEELATAARGVILERDVERAFAMETDDDAMDDLHRRLFTVLMAPEWPHGTTPAIDATLLGRFYERFADHAVAVARRVVFMVTGKMPDPPEA